MPPPSVYSAFAFLGAIIGALLLSCAITVLIMTSFFWTISGEGMLRLFPAFMLLTAGLIVPLPFFPDVLQPILSVLPFRGIIDVPFRLYMGHISPDKAPLLILQQFVWSAILIMIGRTVLKMGLKRTVIQGG
jgi:ABC-2 type transport system permease protein